MVSIPRSPCIISSNVDYDCIPGKTPNISPGLLDNFQHSLMGGKYSGELIIGEHCYHQCIKTLKPIITTIKD